jgi:hypothetical protein
VCDDADEGRSLGRGNGSSVEVETLCYLASVWSCRGHNGRALDAERVHETACPLMFGKR